MLFDRAGLVFDSLRAFVIMSWNESSLFKICELISVLESTLDSTTPNLFSCQPSVCRLLI